MDAYRIRCLLAKELAQIRRNKRILGMLLVAPVVQLLVIGFAATTDIRDIRVAVRDNDRSWHSREYVRALGASGSFETLAADGPAERDEDWLVSGRAGLVLAIPRGFGRDLAAGRAASAQALVDGADANFGVQGLNRLQQATRRFTGDLAERRRASSGAAAGPRAPRVTVLSRVWYNPGLDSHRHMVPGIMALLMMVVTMIVTSMALVKEEEDGTMEQVIVTPLRPFEIVAGKLLPFVLIGFVELTFGLLAIRWVFLIPCRGSLVTIYAVSGVFLLTTLGLGLLVSTLVRNQQQAMLVSTFFVMMPFVLLSGFAFPVENMPPAIQALTNLIPLKYYVAALRAVFLKGAGWAELWPEALTLLAWGAGILGLATWRFRRRVG
jgi:ABC-2 type transport system permease protein